MKPIPESAFFPPDGANMLRKRTLKMFQANLYLLKVG